MRNKLLSFSIALLASVCLWLYIVNVVNPEKTTLFSGVPVVFSGEEVLREDLGLIITDGSTQTVSLKLTGKRTILQKLSSENLSVRVDVSRIRKADTYEMSYEIVYPSDITPSDLRVEGRSPSVISFKVEKLASKTIEVRGLLDGELAEGYMAGTMTYNFDEIVIEGPEAIISKVSYALVELTRSNVDKTVMAKVPYKLMGEDKSIVDSTEVTADVTEIEVTLPVLKTKDVPLQVKFVSGGGATENDVIYEITPQIIQVAGDAATVDTMNQITLETVDLSQLMENSTTHTVPIVLPDGIRSISGEEMATVKLTLKGLDTKTIRITKDSIGAQNVPEGYVYDVVTTMLQVVIRAPSSEIGKISANNVRAIADLSGQTKEGTYTANVTISIDGFEKAGVIGEYSCVVTLQKES